MSVSPLRGSPAEHCVGLKSSTGSALCGLLVACAALLASPASAQTSEDRIYVGFHVARGTAIGTEGGKLEDRRQIDILLPLPPLFLGKSILVPTFGYEARWLGLEPRASLAEVPEEELGRRFHRIQLGLMLIRPLPPRWLLIMGASGISRTDFRGPFSVGMDMSWVGFAIMSYKIGGDPGLRLSFGLVAQWPFDRLPVLPMVGFIYRKGPYILEVGVPHLTLLRKLGDGLELGLTGRFEQQVFHARIAQAGPTLGAYYVRERALRVAPTVNVRLGSGSLWLSSALGLDFLNDDALLDRHRKRLELGSAPTRPTPYVRLSLSWRPPQRMPKEASPSETASGAVAVSPSPAGRSRVWRRVMNAAPFTPSGPPAASARRARPWHLWQCQEG